MTPITYLKWGIITPFKKDTVRLILSRDIVSVNRLVITSCVRTMNEEEIRT